MIPADTVGGIGESAMLARLFPRLPAAQTQLLGPGDDAAVLAAPDGRYVVTTDMMIHGPDFRLAWSSGHDLGWKAAASNLADIAAMGAVPTALVVAIAAPSDSLVSLLEGIADGLRDGCAALAPGCGVVGGDLSVSNTLTIAVTAFGDLEGRDPVLRSGARVGDVIAVCGALGMAAAGLRLLFSHGMVDGEPDVAAAASLRDQFPDTVGAQLAPVPPVSDGRRAAIAGATAMLDLSDGLAIDTRRIAVASGVIIDLDSLAIGSREALDGGEDHSLLAAFPHGTTLPTGFRAIGVVVEDDAQPAGSHSGGLLGGGLHGGLNGVPLQPGQLLVDGRPYNAAGGWDPYSGWDGGIG
jgi:thiamine-monophosphate kinase